MTDRTLFKIIPGQYYAWITAAGEVESATLDVNYLEMPMGAQYVGSWPERPSGEELAEAVRVVCQGAVLQRPP